MHNSKTFDWKAVSLGAGALAGLVTQRLLEAVWTRLRHTSSPPMPADRRSPWVEALSWAAATGVAAGVARLLAVRTAAVAWEVVTHEPPPDVVDPAAA
jgi:hypothetical protein